LPGLINNIETAIFAKEVAPGRAGQAASKNESFLDSLHFLFYRLLGLI